jgi:hypothetical protein
MALSMHTRLRDVMRAIRDKHFRWTFGVIVTSCVLGVVACSLNPQPLPPEQPTAGSDSGALVDGNLFGSDGSANRDAAIPLDGEPPTNDGGQDGSEDAPTDAPSDAPDGGG